MSQQGNLLSVLLLARTIKAKFSDRLGLVRTAKASDYLGMVQSEVRLPFEKRVLFTIDDHVHESAVHHAIERLIGQQAR